MKNTVAIASLLATAALAKPLVHEQLHKRHFEYVEDVDTVYTTVTAGSTGGWGSWGSWSGWGGNTATTSAQPVAPTPTFMPSAPSSSAPAPVVTGWSAPTPSPVNTGGDGWGSSSPSPVQSGGGGDGWGSSSASPSSPSSTGATSGSGPGGVDIGAILDQHNAHRRNTTNDTPDLSWDTDLASIAAQIAASCVYAHDTSTGGGGYGQNIGAGAPPSGVPAMITNEMYNGEINYYPTPYGSDNPDMSNFEQWGHYSQIVWKSTTSVGCATQYCPNGLANAGSGVSPYFTVCNYKPAGNFGGQYSNVGQPANGASVSV